MRAPVVVVVIDNGEREGCYYALAGADGRMKMSKAYQQPGHARAGGHYAGHVMHPRILTSMKDARAMLGLDETAECDWGVI